MDQELQAKLGEPPQGARVIFSIGRNTRFGRRDGKTIVHYVKGSGEWIEHELRRLSDLYEGDEPFDSSGEDWVETHLPFLTSIESAINSVQRADPDLKDRTVIAVLERLVAKARGMIASVRSPLERLRQDGAFRLSDEVAEVLLRASGENA